jgi:hypothetical protein
MSQVYFKSCAMTGWCHVTKCGAGDVDLNLEALRQHELLEPSTGSPGADRRVTACTVSQPYASRTCCSVTVSQTMHCALPLYGCGCHHSTHCSMVHIPALHHCCCRCCPSNGCIRTAPNGSKVLLARHVARQQLDLTHHLHHTSTRRGD